MLLHVHCCAVPHSFKVSVLQCAHDILYIDCDGVNYTHFTYVHLDFRHLIQFIDNMYLLFVIDTGCDLLIFKFWILSFKCRTWIASLFLVVNDTEMKIVINWINCSETNLPSPSSALASSSKHMKNFIRHLFWANKCIICRCISKISHTSPVEQKF